MATHDYNLANQTGANFRADLNNALSAILSNNSSATEPTTTAAYMLWVDTGNNLLKMRNSADNAWITLPVSITTSNTVDIDGGTVNTITSLSFNSGATVTTILDEDDLSSDSATALATQQSIKAYVDSQVTAQDLDFQGDTGGALSIDLDSETFTISGGDGIDTSGALNTLTIAIDSSVVTLTDTQTLTNKTIDVDNNTVSNLEVDNLKTGVLDTDLTSVSASDDTLASAKAIKTYVDAQVTAQDLDLTDGTTSISIDLDSEELSVLGGTGVTSTASGNGVTLAIGQDVGTTADVTFNTVAADLTGDVTGTVSSISNHSTSNLSEGTNLYYTDARARAAISVSGDLSYNSSTGVLSFTERTDAEVRGLISASGDLSYNSTTGVMSFTERTDSEVRGLLSGGTGVTYNSSTGEIAIGQAVSTTSDVTFNDVVVSGDLTVSGTTTSVNTETINLADNIILFNSNATGTPTENAGIEIERGDATNKTLIWNESTDKWTVGSETFVAGTFEGALTGNVTGTVSDISNHDTDDLSEGSTNLYYTTARFDSAFSGKSTSDLSEGTNLYHTTERVQDVTGGQLVTNGSHTGISFAYDDAGDGAIDATVSLSGFSTSDLSEGTNLYYTDARFDTRLATKSTSDLAEGTNLYYTDARFDTRLATKTTDNLTEGSTNLYYADSLVDSHLSGGTGVTYSSGVISIGQAVGTTDDVTFNSVTVTDEVTGDIDGAIQTSIRNTTGSTIYKGQAVYVTGLSGDTPTVALARADSASTMPAVGIARADINNNSTGQMTVLGTLEGIDTSSSNNIETGVTLSVNDVLYISATEAGNVTNTPPTGESNLIQNLGRVVRVSPDTNMTFSVQGAGRTNATPNLNSGKIFYGNGSNQSTPTTLDTSIVPENTNLYHTTERVQDVVGGMVTGNTETGITVTYQDADGTLDFEVGTLNQDTTGNAATATALETARDFSITGDITAAAVSFDGTGNVALSADIDANTVGITELNVTDGTNGQALTTDGAGNLSFADAGGYGDSDVESYLDGGTSTPTFADLNVSNTSGNAVIDVIANNTTGLSRLNLGDSDGTTRGGLKYDHSDDSLTIRTNGSDKAFINSSGDTGIGTTSPTSKLHVDAGSYAGYAVDLVQGGVSAGSHTLRLLSSSGTANVIIARASATTVFYVDGGGNYYFAGSNQSDLNKKENIGDITDSALDLITQLQPKTYNFIGSDIDKAGFIAQEMEQVIPRLVTGNEFDPTASDDVTTNPTGKGIDYMGYTAYLTKAIQEQQTIIDDLKARIETLENA